MRKAEVYLEYQPLISGPPVSAGGLFQEAARHDDRTIAFWKHQWIGQMAANKQRFGSFAEHSAAQEFNKHRYKPVIVAGAGPSLKVNAHELKNRGEIPLVSCLHNFHYFEDLGLAPEYYVTLDAGEVTIEEVFEGGTKKPEEYWEMTKDRTLIAFVATHPGLLAKWQGKILFFNAPIPDKEVEEAFDKVESFGVVLGNGGNVLGSCLSFSKAILGSSFSIFVGADFSFGYDRKFHSWDSKYDAKMGHTMRVTDIYGNSVHTWASYYGFKSYFESVPMRCDGIYYNCTEGGILGSYPGGNIPQFRYMDLKDCLKMLNSNQELRSTYTDPAAKPRKLLYL
jgi:hypothetical protein